MARRVAVLAVVAVLGSAGQCAASATPSRHGHHHQHRSRGGHHTVAPSETTNDLPLTVAALVALGQLLALGRVILAGDAVENRRGRR